MNAQDSAPKKTNMATDAKARERRFLSEVAALCPDFPVGGIVDHESPDFLVVQEADTCGIEMVEYLRGRVSGGSVDRRNEVTWQRVADEARREFEETSPVPLMVHFKWHPQRNPRQADIGRLSHTAAALILNHVPGREFEQIRLGDVELEGTRLDEFVHSITVLRVRDGTQSHWSCLGAGFIDVQVEEIEHVISEKGALVHRYLENCTSVWLVIVADGSYISSRVSVPEPVVTHGFHSRFERVLLYDRPSQRVVRLTTHPYRQRASPFIAKSV